MRISTAIKCIVAGILLVAAGLAARRVARETSPERVRGALYAELARSLDADVTLGSARLGLDGTLTVEGAGLRPRGLRQALFECPKAVLGLDLFELLHGRAVPADVALLSPTFRLLYSPEKGWNFRAVRLKGSAGTAAPPERLLRGGLAVEDARILVQAGRLYGDGTPRSYEGLYLRATRDAASIGDWRFEGTVRRGPLQGLRFSGWFSAGSPPRFNLEFSARDLAVDEDFWNQLPRGESIWRDFQVRGRVSVVGRLCVRGDGGLDYSVTAELSDGRVRTKYFPMTVSSASGRIEVNTSGITINGMRAVLPAAELGDPSAGPAHVRFEGSYPWHRRRTTTRVEVSDATLCRSVVEAVPTVGKDLWARLKPGGRCNALVRLSETSQTDGLRFDVALDLKDATLKPREIPFPLAGVHGAVFVDNGAVRLRGLSGAILTPGTGGGSGAPAAPRFQADGLIALGGGESRLEVHVRDLKTSRTLVESVPEVGARIWKMFQPDATVDADVTLRGPLEGGAKPEVVLTVRDATVQPSFAAVPLTDLRGTLRVDGEKIEIGDMRGTLCLQGNGATAGRVASSVWLTGTVEPARGRAELYVEARELSLDRSLFQSIPGVGQQIWDAAHPRGLISVSGSVRYDAARAPQLRYLLNVDMMDVSMKLAAAPVPISAVSGRLLVTEDRIVSSTFSGVTCGGRFDGAAIVYYGTEGEPPSYGATFDFDRLDLAELLQELTGQQRRIRGRLAGVVDVGGVLDKNIGPSARGNLSISEAYLWQNRFFAALLQVLHLNILPGSEQPTRGQMEFTMSGGRVRLRQFDMVGGGLDLSGYGSVWLDGRLDLTMVAVGAREKGRGIPLLSAAVGWILRGIERQLMRVDVSGTVQKPKFRLQVLSRITSPLVGLHNILWPGYWGGKSPETERR